MDSSVNVAVMVAVEVDYGVDYLVGFLGGCCVVEVDEWVAVDLTT
jgi:hypothetical protein